MIRILSGITAKRFALLYEGFVIGATIAKERGKDVRRLEGSILDKLDAVSEENSNEKDRMATGDLARTLREGAVGPTFTQREHDLVVKYVESVPWKVSSVRAANDMEDWLSAADKVEELPK